MRIDKSTQTFLSLVRAGLWEKEAQFVNNDSVDYSFVYQLAEEQSVMGLVAEGIDRLKLQGKECCCPQEWALQFIGCTLQIEQQNRAMNSFIAKLVEKLKYAKLSPILIKGQGIAKCYERPLWRTSGDVDLLLDSSDYEAAKHLLMPYTQSEPKETAETKEYSLTIEDWSVELHGTLHCRLTKRLDTFLDRIQDDICRNDGVKVWKTEDTDIILPSIDNDVFVIFTHIVKHFFREGVGLRQLCDWCRLLWTYRSEMDLVLLKSRLKEAGMMSEWKAFSSVAVDWLGMPAEAMPFYSNSYRWREKSRHIISFIFETGSFGHNRDYSYNQQYPKMIRKAISLWRHSWDLSRQFFIFPLDSIKAWRSMVRIGVNGMEK